MSFAQRREIYKQLKNVSAKYNDKPEELRFHSLEMNSYAKELSNTTGRIEDKFILKFNGFTNVHGQSWIRPFMLILIVITGTYFPIKYLLGFTHLTPQKWPTAVGEMLECINPVRKFGDSFGLKGSSKDINSTSWAKILDFLFLRLILGLLIFQMVKAFRKYVK